ncbi:secretogranin-2 [Carassius auratus]|uniref:Secretogranin II n=1 Tax=Carassius auratus TaxID=7957 RepID=Q9YI32_CARAU|nr:secretogranin-2-like [Carassius auratus]AAC94994.1 secretogranin II precursor [Carassius auratus]
MPSSSRCCATGVFILPSLLLLPLFFLSLICGVQGATLREHRLSESEPVSYGPASQIRPPPSAEMLRALRYIQSLSQRTPPDTLDDERQQDTSDDMESIRSMMQLAAPSRMDRGMDESKEREKDKTQELLQAVLTTLQQTEEHMMPQKNSQKVITPSQPRYAVHPFPGPKQQLEMETSSENYGRTSWTNPDTRRQHRKLPPMFDNEEDMEQPLKRTNENAEEQYTPQKLATLQSVFEELSGIAASNANSKREDGEDDDDNDNDLYRQRKMVLEDIMGTDEWAPLEEQTETQEEERERHGFNRNLEDDEQEEDEEDDDVKRSIQPDWFQTEKEEEPEDIAKLVDYYLLKILEKKEQEQQKRQEAGKSEQESDREVEEKDADEDEDEEEDDKEEREIKPVHSTLPESLSQIIKISQMLQIPPEEVLELLQNEKQKDLFRIPTKSRTPYATAHKTFAASPHRRPIEASEGNSVDEDIMNILELVNAAQQNNRPVQAKTSSYYERETGRNDYDDTVDEDDELANYLAPKMVAHGQRRARLTPSRDEDQPVYERADYFEKSAPEKRPGNHENAAAGLDNNTMLQILRFLDPESDDADEIDSEGKTVPEM